MHISPFRYPGGKWKVLAIIMEYLSPLLDKHNSFIDVFVGGGSVLLEVASKYPKIALYANDKDYNVYSFWNIVAGCDSVKLQGLLDLMSQPVTLELFYKLRQTPPKNDIEAAYHAIFFNRTTFSGIAYSGPIGGKEQKSKYTVDCRYNFKKLKDKILKCNKILSNRTTVTNNDFSFISQLSSVAMYLDPPYYNKGDALYIEKMNNQQHKELSQLLQLKTDWVLSYDDCNEIRELYNKNQIIDLATRYCINGKKDNWEDKNELIIIP